MTSRNVPRIVVLIVCAATMLTARASQQAAAQTTHAKAPESMMSMPWVAPLFIADQNFVSTVVLVNSTPIDGPTEVTLRSRQGATLVTQNVVVSSNTTKRLDVGQMLSAAGINQTTGSIVVMPMVGNVAAQLSMTYRAQPTPSYVDEELAMPMSDSSPVLRAVAENAHGTPIVAVTSTAAVLEHITIRCLNAPGQQFSKTVPLSPGASITAAACSASTVNSVEDILAAQPSDNSAGAYGIEVSSDGPAGGFSAFGLIAHRATGAQYFSALSFLDPMMVHSSSTVFAGVPLGTSAYLPVGTYSLAVAIANFGTAVAHVRVSLAHTVGSTASSVVVATQTVAPGQSLTLTPSVDPSILGLQNSFIVASDAAPGALVSKVVSMGTGNLHEVELLAKDEQDPPNGGTHPWSLQDGSEAELLLFNHTGKQQDVRVGVNGIWKKTYHIETMATIEVSIRDLVDQQVKDDQGRVLPTTIRDGVVTWYTTRSSVGGRLLQANITSGMARSFSCTAYDYIWDGNGATPVVIANNGNPTIDDGSSITIGNAKPYRYQSYVQYCDLNGTDLGTDPGTFTYLWSDGGPYYNLSDLNSTLSSYSVTGSAPGAESYSVDLDDGNGCGATGGGTVYVRPVINSLSLSANLWWFGGYNPTGYNTSVNVSASVTPSAGSFAWTITAGTSLVQFSNNSSSITTSTSSTTIHSTGATGGQNDVTISLTYTVNSVSATRTMTLSVRAPYQFVSMGQDGESGAAVSGNNCVEVSSGATGWASRVHYKVINQFSETVGSVGLHEAFGSRTSNQTNNWPGFTNLAQGYSLPSTALFDDYICIAGTATPQMTAPANPLGSNLVDYVFQDWYVGTTTVGANPTGVHVQSNLLYRYLDHGTHFGISSPPGGYPN